MEILPRWPTVKAPAGTFAGDAWFGVIARGEEPSRIRVNVVRFALGPETGWGAQVSDEEYTARPAPGRH